MRIRIYYRKGFDEMELNYFKNIVFDLLNESDSLDISDIEVDDRKNTLTVCISDGSAFELICQQTSV